MRAIALLAVGSLAAGAEAQAPPSNPLEAMVRRHYYEQLERRPLAALGWELALPGAGSYYDGLYAPAVATLSLSVLGASLWVAGARREHEALMWAGVATFAGARSYGLVAAPIGALLLNAAFRRQLGLSARF